MGKFRKVIKSLMPQLVLDHFRNCTPVGALQTWARAFARQSYAQDGEDLLILSLIGDMEPPGFYADVGAYHPARYSNTLLFYLNGWRGINIDARPGSMKLFDQWRCSDINLEIGVSGSEGEAIYHMFNEPALNCFSKEIASSRNNIDAFHLVDRVSVVTEPLRAIFSKHLPASTVIDFLSVDVEGMDLEVLKSNDWDRWRPSLVLTEDLNIREFSSVEATDVGKFMRAAGYVPCAKTRLSLCFAEESRLRSTDLGLKVQRCLTAPK